MSEVERIYTINLGKVLLSQSQHRAVRATNMIKEFARHHMKIEDIKIEEELAEQIWARGVRSPPRKIRVRMNKTEEGHILVTPYNEDTDYSPAQVTVDEDKADDSAKIKELESKEPADDLKEPVAEADVKSKEPLVDADEPKADVKPVEGKPKADVKPVEGKPKADVKSKKQDAKAKEPGTKK